MDKEFASKQIADLLNTASKALDAAVVISEASGVSFELPWGGEGTSEAGIGAKYLPEGHPDIENVKWYQYRQGWNPSAGTC